MIASDSQDNYLHEIDVLHSIPPSQFEHDMDIPNSTTHSEDPVLQFVQPVLQLKTANKSYTFLGKLYLAIVDSLFKLLSQLKTFLYVLGTRKKKFIEVVSSREGQSLFNIY